MDIFFDGGKGERNRLLRHSNVGEGGHKGRAGRFVDTLWLAIEPNNVSLGGSM